jgi:uncharacterized protein YegL
MNQGLQIKVFESPKQNGVFATEIKVASFAFMDNVHIALFLDVSGSMEGERLTTLKNTLIALLRSLSPTDCLTIITYSSNAEILCSYRQIGEDPEPWISMINSLRANGNTNIEAAFTTFAKNCRSAPHAIILLTDGHVNTGASSAKAIMLPLETNYQLSGIAVFTLGVGNDHNQIMLRDIALNTQGNYFHCDRAEDLPQTFGSILGILRDRPAEDIEISLPAEYAWLERHVPNDKRTVHLNFLPGALEQRFVFRATVDKPTSAPYLSIQCFIKGLGRQHLCTFTSANVLSPIADAEMCRLDTMVAINKATNLLAGDQVIQAIEKLEGQLGLLESDSALVTLPQIMGLRSILLDLIDGMKKRTQADTSPLLSRMTSMTTSLAVQRNSAFDSPVLERLYTTSAMRSQTANVTAEYEYVVKKNDSEK